MWLLFCTILYIVGKSILVVAIRMYLIFCEIIYIVAKSIIVGVCSNLAVILYNYLHSR